MVKPYDEQQYQRKINISNHSIRISVFVSSFHDERLDCAHRSETVFGAKGDEIINIYCLCVSVNMIH